MCAIFSESYEAMATSKAADTGELDEKPNREHLQREPSRTASTARRIRQPGSGLGQFATKLAEPPCPLISASLRKRRDENDILGFDFKIEWACGVGAESALNE